MTTYVGLLRGINVGGNNKVPMAALRALCQGLGYADVETYIQSGNVVFDAPSTESDVVADVEAALLSTFRLTLSVVVRSAEQVAAVVAGNPYTGEADGTKVHITFLSDVLPGTVLAKLDPGISPSESFAIVDRDMYLHLPGGLGTSKLAVHLGQKLGKRGTTRNWNTVLTLREMSTR